MAQIIGRDPELEALRTLLSVAKDGDGAIVVVAGEAGAGKTALLQTFAAEARSSTRTAWGDSYEGEGVQAFWPWLQVLGALGEAPHHSEAARAASAALGGPGSEAGARFAAFNLVAGVLRADEPLLIVLDDLHWADGESLALLEFLAPLVKRSRVLLAAGVRPGTHPSVDATLGSLLRRGAQRLDLKPFSGEHVEEVLARAGANPSATATVLRATGGNPMFVTELARHLGAGGSLSTTPSSLTVLLRAELRRLSPAAQRLAAACAALDGSIDPGLALRVAQARAEALDELAAAGFVDVDGAAFRFRHDTIRDAIRAGMGTSERARLDAVIAAQAVTHDDLTLVAVHGCRAAAEWDPARAHAAAVALRDQLAGRFAVEAAARIAALGRGIRHLVALTPRERLAVTITDGEIATAAGRHSEAREILREGASLARELDDPEALARVALVFGLGYEHGLAHDSEVLALLHEALERLPAASHGSRARVLSRLAWQELQPAGVRARDTLSAQAVAEARMSEEPGALAAALNARCWGLATPGNLAERRLAANEAWAAARDAGDLDMELGALMWRFRCELEAGNIPAARTAAEAFDAITTRVPLPYHRWYAYLFRGALAALEGRFDEARALAAEIDPVATTQAEQAEVNLLALVSDIDIAQGAGTIARGLHGLRNGLDAHIGLGWLVRPHQVAVEEGTTAGRVALAKSMEVYARLAPDEDWLAITTALACGAILCRDVAVARTLHAALAPYATSWVVVANGASCRGPVAGYLAGLAQVIGRSDDAEAHRRSALDAVRRAGAHGLEYWMTLAPIDEERPQRARTGLTPREAEVLALVARGHTNQEIAGMLVLSVRTVQRHVENLYGRLGLHSRAAATLAAVELGLVEPGDVRGSRTG